MASAIAFSWRIAIQCLRMAGAIARGSSQVWATYGHFLFGAGPAKVAMAGADDGLCLDADCPVNAGFSIPIPGKYTFFNTPVPANVQHRISGGMIRSPGYLDSSVTYPRISELDHRAVNLRGSSNARNECSGKMSVNSISAGLGKSFLEPCATQI